MIAQSSFIGLLISLTVLILGFNCINLGLISPIEVVEEWGCHDTEIRLTCGHLDSKLAILEATFTPNCTETYCLRINLKKLAEVYLIPRHLDTRFVEAEAGRKFLETLRSSHLDDDQINGDDEDGKEESGDDVENELSDYPRTDRLVESPSVKRSNTLRASLERLIIRYLRKLSESEEFDFHVKRSARFKRYTPDTYSGSTERIIIGERNVTVLESDLDRDSDLNSAEQRLREMQESKSVCSEQKRKVSSLDRFDIEHSFQNESDEEYNIRKLLNRRCSGRNHCSFLFAADHPFSKIWSSGFVRVKYICMDDFRINQYCNEHLTIDYEVTPEDRMFAIDDNVEPTKGDPVAEARVQPQDQNYHSVKILHASEDDVREIPSISTSRKRKIKVQTNSNKKGANKEKIPGVYSQDFKALKILPSNLDDFNDIERIGDVYFRTNDKFLKALEPDKPTVSTYQKDAYFTTTGQVPSGTIKDDTFSIPHTTTVETFGRLREETPKSSGDNNRDREDKDNDHSINNNNNNDVMGFPEQNHSNYNKFENITIIIREGEQYIITFPSPRVLDNLSVNISTGGPHSSNASYPTLVHYPDINYTTPPLEMLTTTTTPETEEKIHIKKNQETWQQSESEAFTTPDDLIVEATDNQYENVDDEDDSNRFIKLPDHFYDNSGDDDRDKGNRLDHRVSYSSTQRTFYGRPLLHGFAMSPGYPKFYIGDYECKWQIRAPDGQKIRVSILDLSLRYDCKDFVNIIDLEVGRNLYNSCSESIRPVEIVSDSNQIQINMVSTTKFAYAKRGLLLHYSALGCVNPPPPKNGHLVNRTEVAAFYKCQPSFVFPDSGESSRKLICTERHSWNRILPDCVEELAISGSGIVANFNLGSKVKNATEKMSNSETDLVYDIIIPATLISGLFIINTIIFVIILRYRRRNKSLDADNVELAQL